MTARVTSQTPMPACSPEALETFARSLSDYVDRAASHVQLRSAALAVWNCLDPLPPACAELVIELTGAQIAPLRFSQAARLILKSV